MFRTPRVILFADASRGFGRGILSGIARYSSLNGPWTFYRKTPLYLNGPNFTLKELAEWKPDGIICPVDSAKDFLSLEIPIIGYDPSSYAGPIPCITSDHASIGHLAAQHLLELGSPNFAFCGFDMLDWSAERCTSFCKTIGETGATVNAYKGPQKKMSWAKEEPLILNWIRSLPKPISIFCVNDDRAASVLECCRLLELGVPEDVAIIGADDDEYICELENPPLSSIRVASDQVGYQGAALLHRMIQGLEKMEGQRLVAPATGVSTRQSTDVLMIQNKEVRKALRFIRENVNRPIRVSDVVAATSLSHRSLNDQFQKELGTSAGKQLTRARIEYITRLLSDTDMQIQEIATSVGYDDDRHFSRYFKRSTGLTPQAYRRKISLP